MVSSVTVDSVFRSVAFSIQCIFVCPLTFNTHHFVSIPSDGNAGVFDRLFTCAGVWGHFKLLYSLQLMDRLVQECPDIADKIPTAAVTDTTTSKPASGHLQVATTAVKNTATRAQQWKTAFIQRGGFEAFVRILQDFVAGGGDGLRTRMMEKVLGVLFSIIEPSLRHGQAADLPAHVIALVQDSSLLYSSALVGQTEDSGWTSVLLTSVEEGFDSVPGANSARTYAHQIVEFLNQGYVYQLAAGLVNILLHTCQASRAISLAEAGMCELCVSLWLSLNVHFPALQQQMYVDDDTCGGSATPSRPSLSSNATDKNGDSHAPGRSIKQVLQVCTVCGNGDGATRVRVAVCNALFVISQTSAASASPVGGRGEFLLKPSRLLSTMIAPFLAHPRARAEIHAA